MWSSTSGQNMPRKREPNEGLSSLYMRGIFKGCIWRRLLGSVRIWTRRSRWGSSNIKFWRKSKISSRLGSSLPWKKLRFLTKPRFSPFNSEKTPYKPKNHLSWTAGGSKSTNASSPTNSNSDAFRNTSTSFSTPSNINANKPELSNQPPSSIPTGRLRQPTLNSSPTWLSWNKTQKRSCWPKFQEWDICNLSLCRLCMKTLSKWKKKGRSQSWLMNIWSKGCSKECSRGGKLQLKLSRKGKINSWSFLPRLIGKWQLRVWCCGKTPIKSAALIESC